jgi:hypothetical protein
MKRFICLLALVAAPACGTLDVRQDPVTGEPVVVNTETGEEVPIVGAMKSLMDSIVPGLGTGLLLIGGGLMARKSKKGAPPTVT